MDWHAYDGGETVGQRGSESGLILLDEEHPSGARITLEHNGVTAPFSITCGVYGVLAHTRFFGTESEARDEFAAMKMGLIDIATMLDSSDFEAGVVAFLEQYP